MKNTKTKIQKYTFLNAWEIEYQIGKDYFVMAIETEDLEGWDSEKYDSPQDFLEETDADIETLIECFHIEMGSDIEPIEKQFSKLYKPKNKKKEEFIFKTTLVGSHSSTVEMVNLAYIEDIAQRVIKMEREIQKLKSENKKKDDILLTTKTIELNYKITPRTINEARRFGRIKGVKINSKEFGYKKRDVDEYFNTNKNYFKNQQYAS